jgi:tetratricopeptide (TPR) repeat protein
MSDDITERFQSAWTAALTNGSPRPALADHVPPAGHPRRPEVVLELVKIDLDCRLDAGDRGLLVRGYLGDPELCLDNGAGPHLIAYEYQCRWTHGDRVPRSDYIKTFPQYAAELADLRPRWDCRNRHCLRERIALPDEAATTVTCPGCHAVFPVDQVFAAPVAEATDVAHDPSGALPTHVGRFRREEEVARGGMGVVYRVRDDDFQRSLAMKVLQEKCRGQPQLERRFLREARLTGYLQHPGIPPVLESGQLPDGRPYFIMKLIEGSSLQQLLHERADPSERTSYFLGVFEQISQTVAYAHKRGILHRDLKPGNVMVGEFGEVQVLDWGLAKELDASPREDIAAVLDGVELSRGVPNVHRARQGLSSSPGTVLGTLAYMAPEQARGEVEQLDRACDVFGLGGILCEILTGQPPFAERSYNENLRLAKQGDVSEALARLDACGADAEVVALARHCLAPESGGRPADAAAVAQKMAAYQERVRERLRQAEVARGRAEVRAVEESRRRRWHLVLAATVAATVLVLMVLVAGVWWWVREQLADQKRAAIQHNAEIQQQKALTDQQAHLMVQNALEQVKTLQTKALWKQARQTLDRTLARLGPDGHEQLAGQVQAVLRNLTLLERLDRIRLDKLLIVDGNMAYAAVPPKYAAAFLEHGLDFRHGEESVLVRTVADSPLRDYQIDYLIAALDDWLLEEPDPQLQARLCRVTADITGQPWRQQQLLAALRDRKQLEMLLTEPLPPGLLAELGWLLQRRGGDGIAVLQAASLRYPTEFWVWFELGFAYLHPGERQEFGGQPPSHRKEPAGKAARAFSVCLALRPDSAVVWYQLGIALASQDDWTGANDAFMAAIRLEPSLGPAYTNLGAALNERADAVGAIDALTTGIRLKPGSALAQFNLGNSFRLQGRWMEAIRAYRTAIRLNPRYANAYNNLGNALAMQDDWRGAIDAFREAMRLDPSDATPYLGLGNVLHSQGDWAGAIAAYRKAILLDPTDALAHNNLGNVLYAQRHWTAAGEAYRAALRLDPKLVVARLGLGLTLRTQGDVVGAIDAYAEAIRLDPGNALAYHYLGDARRDQKDWAGAITAYQEAIRLDRKNVRVHCNVGAVLGLEGKWPEAMEALHTALRLDPTFALAHYNLGVVLHTQGDLAGALRAYRAAVRLNPKDALARWGLGDALAAQKNPAEAKDAYRAAIGLDPNLAGPYYSLGRLLRGEGDLAGAMDAFRKTIALQPSLAEAHLEFAYVLGRLDLFLECSQAFQVAFVAGPQLASNVKLGHRKFAALAALLAAAGEGNDAADLSAGEQANLRQQALGWLKADLIAWDQLLHADGSSAPLVSKTLGAWQQDKVFATTRDGKGLAHLPRAERQPWRQFWTEVDQLLKRAAR